VGAGAAAELTMYIAREASKVWRKVTAEITVELQLLRDKWGLLLAGLIFQRFIYNDFAYK